MIGRPWTPAEEEILRATYPVGGVKAAAAALPARTPKAVVVRAHILGLRTRTLWTAEEEKTLRCMLEDGRSLKAIRARLGRTRSSIVNKAKNMGWSCGLPPGYESLTQAAERTGFEVSTLRRILAAASVRLYRRRCTRKKTARPQHYVEPFAVDDAVEAYMQTETVRHAAIRRGLCPMTLRKRLRQVGVVGPPRKFLRVTEEQIQHALRAA